MARKESVIGNLDELAINLAETFNLSAKDIKETYANDVEGLGVLYRGAERARKGVRSNVFWTVAIPVMTLNPLSLILTLGTSQFLALPALWTAYKIYDHSKNKAEIKNTLENKIQWHRDQSSNAGDQSAVPQAPAAP